MELFLVGRDVVKSKYYCTCHGSSVHMFIVDSTQQGQSENILYKALAIFRRKTRDGIKDNNRQPVGRFCWRQQNYPAPPMAKAEIS